MNLKDFSAHKDWVKVWSGRWSLYTDSHFGIHWTVENVIFGKPAFAKIIYLYKDGITNCWVNESEKSDLGNRLVALVREKHDYPQQIASDVKVEAQKVTACISSHTADTVGSQDLKTFWHLVGEYYLPLISVKYVVDYLSPKELKKILPVLEEARLKTEPIFRDVENFVEEVAKATALKSGYSTESILSTLGGELDLYFSTGKLPAQTDLESRYHNSAIVFQEGRSQLFTGNEVAAIERILFSQESSDVIQGQTAFKGKVRGIVKIVWNPAETTNFQKGDILVTGMTRPEFLSLMKKAGAFVTDAGGILSHAAIVAREMQKPCVIGTRVATKVLKDGDVVEVDADSSIVKIIERVGEK